MCDQIITVIQGCVAAEEEGRTMFVLPLRRGCNVSCPVVHTVAQNRPQFEV